MNRCRLLGVMVIAMIAAAVCPRALIAADATAERPNLIMILIDDMGWCDTGFAGNKLVETPNLDRLARSGITFTQAYAAAPNCAPTRACLMTGQYTPRHGVYTVVDDHHKPGQPYHRILAAESKAELDTDAETMAETLRHQGYATGMVGMWNLGRGRRGPCTPAGQGFDTYVDSKQLGFERDAYQNAQGKYLTDRMTDAGLDFIRANKAKPFFVYLAYHAIHDPFDPKQELLTKYKRKSGVSGEAAAYLATIEALDQNIGRLWTLLKSLGLDERTYLFFTSDNGGTHQYTEPLRGGKGTLYEGGIRVPAFAVGPGIKPNQSYSEPISSIDFFPTFAELSGAKATAVDGVSLVPPMIHGGRLSREALFWHFPCYIGRGTPASAVRMGRYKLIEFFDRKSIELYDIETDPAERNDLSKSQPELAQKLYARLKTWQRETGAPCPAAANPKYDPAAKRQRGRKPKGPGKQRKKEHQ